MSQYALNLLMQLGIELGIFVLVFGAIFGMSVLANRMDRL